jgi:hypothetical protein
MIYSLLEWIVQILLDVDYFDWILILLNLYSDLPDFLGVLIDWLHDSTDPESEFFLNCAGLDFAPGCSV